MNVFHKSSFTSRIGKIYYIWVNKDELKEIYGSEMGVLQESSLNGTGREAIIFLGNVKEEFEKYLDFLKIKFPGCRVPEEKSKAMEKEILSYLKGDSRCINIQPLFLSGTDFEKRVWQCAREIPYGSVRSYKELARSTGNPKAFRAAGSALGRNPVMLVVPCHRIIKSDGRLGNFGGGVEIKQLLLEMEQGDLD